MMKKATRTERQSSRDIAIIGGGIAGLTAAYLLERRHRVTLFEKSARLGGNAFTHTTSTGQDVDIAVAAFGRAGYEDFYGLLHELGVDTEACPSSYVSLHNLDTERGLYFVHGNDALSLRNSELLRPRNIWTIIELLRGLHTARRLLGAGTFESLTLEQALEHIPRLSGDARLILLCALCLLSSMSAREVLDSPAAFFFNKLKTHHDVLSPKAVYSVRCVSGFTRSYVDALAGHYRESIHLSCEVRSVRRNQDGVHITLSDGSTSRFDDVIFACNADQALAMLELPTDEEKRLLGPWKYKDGKMVLHTDHSSFPRRELMQAYTFLYTERRGELDTSVNGALWHLPGVPSESDYICTQHQNFPIREDHVDFRTVLRTPIFDNASCETISQLPTLNGVKNTYYCGSHFGFGLHNDAVRSAMDVAAALGAQFKAPSTGAMRRRALSQLVARVGAAVRDRW